MQLRSRHEFHDSELALIAKYQTPFVVEIEDRVRMLWHLLVHIKIEKLSGHAKMHGQDKFGCTRRGSSPAAREGSALLKLNQNEFAASRNGVDAGALQFSLKR